MIWKQEAIEKLRQYEAKRLAVKTIPMEIKRLELDMRSIRSATSDGSPVSGGGSGREDMYLSNIMRREELERSLRQAEIWVSLVDAGLKILSPEERLILDRFYINPARGNVDRLCGELGIEKSQVYFRKDAALHHFTISLYGCSEI